MDRSQLNKILQARQHLDQLLDQEQEQEVESSTWRALAVAQDEMLKNLLESFRYKDDRQERARMARENEWLEDRYRYGSDD